MTIAALLEIESRLPHTDLGDIIRNAIPEIKAMVEALQSIANNSCCEGCQEAKLVALKAIGAKP